MNTGCGPLPLWLIRLYIENPVFALLVDTLAAIGVLYIAGLILRPLKGRLGSRAYSGLRLITAAMLVLLHEYFKEGYFFDPRDFPVFPPRSHESFLAYLLALGYLLVRVGLPLPP